MAHSKNCNIKNKACHHKRSNDLKANSHLLHQEAHVGHFYNQQRFEKQGVVIKIKFENILQFCGFSSQWAAT